MSDYLSKQQYKKIEKKIIQKENEGSSVEENIFGNNSLVVNRIDKTKKSDFKNDNEKKKEDEEEEEEIFRKEFANPKDFYDKNKAEKKALDEKIIGMQFKSDEEVEKFMDNLSKKREEQYWVSEKQTKKRLKNIIRKSANSNVKSNCIEYSCVHGGEKRKPASTGKKKLSKKDLR